ncbi:Alpha,alpha-trehalose-phosphate synthase UDP-forming [Hondaea fermentalgiana]|uniref:Alpha,alpha-trehalose-phosphate synthase UDP-forming n=1 Tax=Hondaea fermentalgiana TaxID=2315210 RepID=A0A2R5GMJ6_9STRA|nr:Alpha,alpha-trehalose-phosphate synthase UDP-forming [Hondaea fermentalgiana]|eukprot:GBG30958.1 Alpha,alpha-trehalose-phosphate synthase UDP-forming [Hondaea fermentalgiana]
MGRGDVVGVGFNAIAPVQRGETVCLVGDVAALGSGDHRYGVQLVTAPDVFPEWYTAQPIPLPAGQVITYRYCILSGGELSRWEDLPGDKPREIFVESPMTINDTLGLPGAESAVPSATASEEGIDASPSPSPLPSQPSPGAPGEIASQQVPKDGAPEGSSKSGPEDEGLPPTKYRLQHKLTSRPSSTDAGERTHFRERRRKTPELESSDGVMIVSHFLPVKIRRAPPRPQQQQNQQGSPDADGLRGSNSNSSRRDSFSGESLRGSEGIRPSPSPNLSGSEFFMRPSPSPRLSTSMSSVTSHASLASAMSIESNLDGKSTRERSDSETSAVTDWAIEWNESALLSRKKRSAADWMRIVYIGVPNVEPPVQRHERRSLRAALARFRCVPVFLDEEIASLHDQFCYDTLRKLFHHQVDVYGPLPTRWWNAKLHEASWQAYREVNQAFLGICVEEYQDTDLIWVHGYELLLLPSMLARRLKRRKPPIGLFIHSPFPSSEIFRTLSVRDELLIGMLNADQIGFHLYEYARPFLSCCHRILGIPHDGNENDRHGVLTVDYQGRRVLITVCHGGIEAELVRHKLRSEAVATKATALLRAFVVPYPAPSATQPMFVEEKVSAEGKPPLGPVSSVSSLSSAFSGASATTNPTSRPLEPLALNADQVIIAGIDELEFLRGIHFKLVSFEKLLEVERSKNSPWVDQLCMLQVLVHIRPENEESREVLRIVRQLARRINQSFPRAPGRRPAISLLEWTSCSFEDRLSVFSIADIIMITPLRSGLGLYAFEYAVVADERWRVRDGPWAALATSPDADEKVRSVRKHSCLVLSEFTAAFRVLPGSLRCNPWRDDEVLESIQSALRMDVGERKARHKAALQYVVNHDETGWALRVLKDIKTARPMSQENKPEGLTPDGLGLGLQFRAVEFRPNFQHLHDDIIIDSYRSGRSRLIVLDYGGTTVSDDAVPQESNDAGGGVRHKFEFRYRPKGEAIVPSPNMVRVLQALVQDPRNHLFIVSGRERHELEAAFADIPGIGLTAEHGCFYSLPGRRRSSVSSTPGTAPPLVPPMSAGAEMLHAPPLFGAGRRRSRSSSSESQELARVSALSAESAEATAVRGMQRSRKKESDSRKVLEGLTRDWITLSDVFDSSWMDLSEQIMDVYTQRTDGTYIERKGSSIVWQFRDAEPEFAALQASELQDHLHGVLKAFPIEVVSGKGYVEVCPQGIDKGNAVAHILDMVNWPNDDLPDFVLCIGDDIADEAMFEFLHELHTNGKDGTHGVFSRSDSVFGSSMQMLAHSLLGRERGSSLKDEEDPSSTEDPGRGSQGDDAGVDTPPSPPFPLSRHHSRGPIEAWGGELFTCVVGEKPSVAQYYVNDVEEVQSLLEVLARVSTKSRASRSMGDILGPAQNRLDDRGRRTYDSYAALPMHQFHSRSLVGTIREDKAEDMDMVAQPHDDVTDTSAEEGVMEEEEAERDVMYAAASAASAAKHHQSFLDLRTSSDATRGGREVDFRAETRRKKSALASASMPVLSEYFSLDVSQPTSRNAAEFLDLVANDDDDDGITF